MFLYFKILQNTSSETNLFPVGEENRSGSVALVSDGERQASVGIRTLLWLQGESRCVKTFCKKKSSDLDCAYFPKKVYFYIYNIYRHTHIYIHTWETKWSGCKTTKQTDHRGVQRYWYVSTLWKSTNNLETWFKKNHNTIFLRYCFTEQKLNHIFRQSSAILTVSLGVKLHLNPYFDCQQLKPIVSMSYVN